MTFSVYLLISGVQEAERGLDMLNGEFVERLFIYTMQFCK